MKVYSRECKAKYCVSPKLWENPPWVKDPFEYNKYMNFICKKTNEEDTQKQKKINQQNYC